MFEINHEITLMKPLPKAVNEYRVNNIPRV